MRRVVARVGVAFGLMAMGATPSATADELHARRVRPLSPELSDLLDAGAAQSASFRGLLMRLERSDVVLHLLCDPPRRGVSPVGRLGFIAARPGHRYLRIWLDCARTLGNPVSALAHELQHAVEIADAATIVDESSMERHYVKAGYPSRSGSGSRAYDTDAARRVARVVDAELEAAAARARAARARLAPAPVVEP